MGNVKLTCVAVLAIAFLGCKAERAGTNNSSAKAAEKISLQKKPEEQNLPKEEYGGLYSDADLDDILRQNQNVYRRDPVAYYYAGNRCADKGECHEAAKLYAMAAEAFQYRTFEYGKVGWEREWKESYPGTLDENGECKEFYYSIYNLSCCMSQLGLQELSEAYLYNAILAGYPYLNHLLSDPDLANLYNAPNGDAVKERAKTLFACGNDTGFFAGKELGIVDGNDVGFYHFDSNGKDVFCYKDSNFSSGFSDEPWCLHGTYTVKNFHVLMYFDSEWQRNSLGNALWTGATSDRYDAYALPVLKETNQTYMLSYVEAFNSRWYSRGNISAESDLVRGTFLESVLDEPDGDCCFLRLSVIDSFDTILVEENDVEWHPEDDGKNREQNRLDAERRKQQAATALIELSKEAIDANAQRRLARYRECADPIIQGYKEKGKVIVLDAGTLPDSEKDYFPAQETEFCYVIIKGTLKDSATFTKIYKTAEEQLACGCFLDFTDCTFVGLRHLKEDDYNAPDRFTFEVYERKSTSISDRNDEPPEAIGIKGIIFPKNIPNRVSVYYENSSLEIMEFQDSAFPQAISFGHYKEYKNNSLKAVRLPEGLEEIEGFAFMKCTALEQVYAPKSLKRIAHYAFDGCTIPAFEIPEHVRFVEEYVFEPCTHVYIPAYRHHPENFDWYDHCFAHTEANIHWGSCME